MIPWPSSPTTRVLQEGARCAEPTMGRRRGDILDGPSGGRSRQGSRRRRRGRDQRRRLQERNIRCGKDPRSQYEAPLLAHATMEPMACAVRITADGCDIWVGTQIIARVQSAVAEATGLPAEKVRVHNFLMGGGFGRRLETDYPVQAAMIAKQVDFPVKVIWTREEDFQHDLFRPSYVDRFSAGLDAKGVPTAFSHRVAASSVMARWTPAWFVNGLDPDAVDGERAPTSSVTCSSSTAARSRRRVGDWLVAWRRGDPQLLPGRELRR